MPYDPSVYFSGEEITLAARAYTHGFDLFHPPDTVCYHSYGRHGARRHWDDHDPKHKTKKSWFKCQKTSVERIRAVLTSPEIVPAKFALGTIRSLRDYELYAGINFAHRIVHPNTLEGLEPPSTHCWNWEHTGQYCCERSGTVTFDAKSLGLDSNSDFWYFGLHDSSGLELVRRDLREPEYLCGEKSDVDVRFWSRNPPKTCTFIAHSKERGWGERKIRRLTSRNYADRFAN